MSAYHVLHAPFLHPFSAHTADHLDHGRHIYYIRSGSRLPQSRKTGTSVHLDNCIVPFSIIPYYYMLFNIIRKIRGLVRTASSLLHSYIFMIFYDSTDDTQLYMSMAMVMGPTPPGTGVIALVCGATFSKSTSPQSLLFSSLWMPTSITTAPSFT